MDAHADDNGKNGDSQPGSNGNGKINGLKFAKLLNQNQVLAYYAQTGVIAESCRRANIARHTVYTWISEDPDFREALEMARKGFLDQLLGEARRRAVEGVAMPVLHQGKQVHVKNPRTGESEPLVRREYSDRLLALLLRKHDPDLGGGPAKKRPAQQVIAQQVKVAGDVKLTRQNIYQLSPKREKDLKALEELIVDVCQHHNVGIPALEMRQDEATDAGEGQDDAEDQGNGQDPAP